MVANFASTTVFDVLDVDGDVNFSSGSAIDLEFDLGSFNPVAGLSLMFLKAADALFINDFTNMIFNFSGLNALFEASVSFDMSNQSLSVNFTNAPVSAVPLPPSLLMFGTGLLGMIGFTRLQRRRRRKIVNKATA